MASSSSLPQFDPPRRDVGNNHNNYPPFRHSAGQLMQSVTANLFSRCSIPLHLNPNPKQNVSLSSSQPPCASGVGGVGGNNSPVLFPFYSSFSNDDLCPNPSSSASPAIRSLSTSVRIDGLGKAASKGGRGGPAFVGQVFSMCDPSGTGLMAVTSHFDIPFLSKRTPEWIKKMVASFTKNEKNGPVFRFFMDLGDAVSYVKKLNIPTGMVGACRLDVAYEHFKEKPHMFQFIPNEKQVKAANRLLKTFPHKSGKRKLDGVPVFTAENLNIAIATNDGIKWYTPYFFDKGLLDNILEASVDQHFHTLIRNRHVQRRGDVIDDNLTAEVVEDNGESLFEPPEVQELLDEMGHPGIPLSVISKAAEIQLLDAVDKVLLGNKWLRRATGIQPKFPYLVDSFEARSEASFLKSAESTSCAFNSEAADDSQTESRVGGADLMLTKRAQSSHGRQTISNDFRLPFGDWFWNPWLKPFREDQRPDGQMKSNTRMSGLNEEGFKKAPPNPLLPKITMVGISTGEAGQVSRATLKKTMDDLTRELEQSSQRVTKLNEDKDPLFVANVGDYSSVTKVSSA